MLETVVPLCILVLAIVLQGFASFRVQKSPSYASDQKKAQLKLIWLLPVLGAAMVLAVMHQDGEFVTRDQGGQQK
jgi:hypothetical protein